MKKLKAESNNDKGGYENVVDIEEESPTLINMEINFGEKEEEKQNKNDREEIINKELTNILTSDIVPEEWQRELEKVSSKLKMDYNTMNFNTVEWRSHIEQIKTNEAVIKIIF
jgi:hypothetical protein